MLKAVLLEKDDAGFRAGLTTLETSRLLQGDVLVQPAYSTLNDKDGLALTNSSPAVRLWAMVPGVDGAGTVLESSPQLKTVQPDCAKRARNPCCR